MDDQIISQEGYDKLKQELDNLQFTVRREIADRIQRAKDQGDLAENAEYNEAKDAQAFNEGRIAELSQMIKNLTVVAKNGGSHGEVAMGSTLSAITNGQEREFTIVSFNEADPLSGKISNESPLGKAFIGHQAGDTVKVVTPKGEVEYKIMKVG
jgi:transcription elongation factor GreA